MFAFIVSNSEILIQCWLVSLDLRINCTVCQLILLAQNALADASEWFPFCSDLALRRNCTLHKSFPQALRNLFPFGARSDRTWVWNSNGDSLRWFLSAFAGYVELLLLGSLLEFPRGRLGTNSVWRPFGSLLLFAIPGDSFSGIPPCFPPLGFTLIVLFARNYAFPHRGFTVLLLSWGTPFLLVIHFSIFRNVFIFSPCL